MLTSWYNGPDNLAWMAGWRGGEILRAYAAGYSLHLIVYTGDSEGPVPSPRFSRPPGDALHDPAAGRGRP